MQRSRPHSLAAFEQPLRLHGHVESIPRIHIRCLRSDVPLDLLAERIAAWPRYEIDTHHDAQIADPDGLAELLSRAAAASP